MSNTRQIIHQATALLQLAGCDSPRLDAELLLMFVWSIERTDLIIRSRDQVPEHVQASFNSLIKRRQQREPIAYIVGEKEFWSRSFLVNSDVLIPRPETEHIIEAVLACFPDHQASYRFCDIGTGSGCIAITLACEYPNAQVLATDISPAALNIAARNAMLHHVEHRISFRQGDMLQALQPDDALCHGIVSNPPYVTLVEMESLQQELFHEPRQALTDERDGLFFLNNILHTAPAHLQAGGFVILETGLCGLPPSLDAWTLERHIYDLAGHLRGGVFRHLTSQHG